jgi:hypothetical protein
LLTLETWIHRFYLQCNWCDLDMNYPQKSSCVEGLDPSWWCYKRWWDHEGVNFMISYPNGL